MRMRMRKAAWTHDPAERGDAQGDLRDVPPLEEVGRLEDLLVRHSVLADGSLKPATED